MQLSFQAGGPSCGFQTGRWPEETEARFNELMRSSYRKVYHLALRLVGNRSDAEDLTQEAFYRAYRSFDGYHGDRPFENWIFRIVTRLFLDLLRSRRRRVQAVSYDAPICPDGADDTVMVETPDNSFNPESQVMNRAVSEELERSLKTLSKEQQLLVWLADVDGMPYQEIAELLKTPIGTIRSRLHRAHKQLRKAMEIINRERENSQACLCGFKFCGSH